MLKPRPWGKERGIDVGIFQLFLELIFPNDLPLILAERNRGGDKVPLVPGVSERNQARQGE